VIGSPIRERKGFMTYVHTSPNKLVIHELYAYVSVDEEGNEGVLAHYVPPLGNVPLVGADMDRMMSYKPYALEIAKLTGMPVRLLKFSIREIMEDFEP
jgi:hypothetical protein